MSSNSSPTLEEMTVKKLRSLLRQKNLPVSGRRCDLIARLQNSTGRSAGSAANNNTAKNEGGDGQMDLEALKVDQLKSLLRQKGLPVSGRKHELVQRLKNGPKKGGPKLKAWQHSDAKKDLKRALLDPTSSIHNMSLENVRRSDDRFGHYPNFAKYYDDLKRQVREEKLRVHQDDVAAEKYRRSNPRSHLNQRGYPHWDTHPAKKLLEVDVANNMHMKMTPIQLRGTNNAYKDFPPDVFAKRVNREVSKQKAAQFWAFKRNKRGMKNYLREVSERANR